MTTENKLFRILLIGSLLAISLSLLRVNITGKLSYIFLSWNLFLAWIPLTISTQLKKYSIWQKNKAIFILMAGFWLLFFPNAPYILTDLFHLRERTGMPLWFDLTLVLSFAWVGLIAGFISLMQMQHILKRIIGNPLTMIAIVLILILCSFGVYLGRYDRYNSWDIITNPVSLFRDILIYIINPLEHKKVYMVTIFFSSFLILSYFTLELLTQYKISKNKNYD